MMTTQEKHVAMLRKRAADARACWHGILKHPVDPEGQELLDGDAMGLRADAAWFDELADLLSLPDIPGPGAGLVDAGVWSFDANAGIAVRGATVEGVGYEPAHVWRQPLPSAESSDE